MTDSISSLFGRSPVRPLQLHMEKVQTGVEELKNFCQACALEDWVEAERIYNLIGTLEQQADDMKNELRANLPKFQLMPVARSDILSLLGMQDKLINCSKDISGLMLGRKMIIPSEIAEIFSDFIDKSIATSAQALRTIQELDALFETGFDSRELAKINGSIEAIDALESECDSVQVQLRAEIMKIENSGPPVQVMFLYRIVEDVGELSDLAHRVGNRLTILLA